MENMERLIGSVCRLLNLGAALIFLFVASAPVARGLRLSPLMLPIVIVFLGLLAWIGRRGISRRIFLALLVFMILLQILVTFFINLDYSGIMFDMGRVVRSAQAWAAGGRPDICYFELYPFNQCLHCLFTLVFKLTLFLFNSMDVRCLMLVNAAFIDVAILFSVGFARIFLPEDRAYAVGAVCCFSAPFYLYVPICYSDTVCLPFLMGGFWLAVRRLRCLRDEESPGVKNSVLIFLSGFCLAIGFVIKGCPIFAAVICCCAALLTLRWKTALLFSSIMALGVVAGLGTCHRATALTGLVTAERVEANRLPLTHNIMMGLKNLGGYDDADVRFTRSFPTFREKQSATTRVIMERVRAFGPRGLYRHLREKAMFNWGHGTCGAEGYIGDSDRLYGWNFLHEIVLTRGRCHPAFADVSQALYLALLIFAGWGFVRSALSRELQALTPLRYFLVACMLFLLVWEAHPRYSFHARLVIIILSVVEAGECRCRALCKFLLAKIAEWRAHGRAPCA